MEWLAPVAAITVALITAIMGPIFIYRTRKKDGMEELEERLQNVEKKQTEIEKQTEVLIVGQRAILHDRIKYLAKCYIKAGEIYLDDREDLTYMHEVYHRLGGNGNLNALMEAVMHLPLSNL